MSVESICQGTFLVITIYKYKRNSFFTLWFNFVLIFFIFKKLAMYAYLKCSFKICELNQNTSKKTQKFR